MDKEFLRLIFIAFLGGMLGQFFLLPQRAEADDPVEVEYLDEFYINGSSSPSVALVTDEGGGNFRINSSDGKMKFQAGIYTEGENKGNPFMSFYGSSKQPRLLFQLAGSLEAPQIIFKDSTGEDRILLGLDSPDPAQTPVIKYKMKDQPMQNLLPK
jgi:hypothetical protein